MQLQGKENYENRNSSFRIYRALHSGCYATGVLHRLDWLRRNSYTPPAESQQSNSGTLGNSETPSSTDQSEGQSVTENTQSAGKKFKMPNLVGQGQLGATNTFYAALMKAFGVSDTSHLKESDKPEYTQWYGHCFSYRINGTIIGDDTALYLYVANLNTGKKLTDKDYISQASYVVQSQSIAAGTPLYTGDVQTITLDIKNPLIK
jgi:hypothetical protein